MTKAIFKNMGFIEVTAVCAILLCVFISGLGVGAIIENNRQAALDLKTAIAQPNHRACCMCLVHHQALQANQEDDIGSPEGETTRIDDNYTPVDLEHHDPEVTQKIPSV